MLMHLLLRGLFFYCLDFSGANRNRASASESAT